MGSHDWVWPMENGPKWCMSFPVPVWKPLHDVPRSLLLPQRQHVWGGGVQRWGAPASLNPCWEQSYQELVPDLHQTGLRARNQMEPWGIFVTAAEPRLAWLIHSGDVTYEDLLARSHHSQGVNPSSFWCRMLCFSAQYSTAVMVAYLAPKLFI